MGRIKGEKNRGELTPHVGWGVIKFSTWVTMRDRKMCTNELANW